MDRAGGVGDLVWEHILHLSDNALWELLQVFNRTMTAGGQCKPESWRTTILTAIPKTAFAKSFQDSRYIGLSDVVQKLFLRTLMEYLEEQKGGSEVWTVGSTEGFSTMWITESVRTTLQLAKWWQGVHAVISPCDVKAAFD